MDTVLRRPIQPGQVSPVIRKTFIHEKARRASRFQFVWGVLDVIIFLLFLLEVNTQYLQLSFIGETDVFRYLVIGVCVSFALSALVNFTHALQGTVSGRPLALSPKQKQLLGIKIGENDDVKPIPLQHSSAQGSVTTRARFTLTALTSTPTQQQHSPVSHSPRTLGLQATVSSSPGSNVSQRMSQCFHDSLDTSNLAAQRRFSPAYQGSSIVAVRGTLESSGYLDSSGGGSPLLRHRMPSFRNSPLSPEDYMTDQKVLSTYLRSHYEKEQQRVQMLSMESSFNSSSGKWGLNKSASFMDTSQELLKNIYQIATPSPKSPTSITASKDDATKYAALEYWRKHGISCDRLTEWTARARKWIAATLLMQLVVEIDKINTGLKKLGCPEIQVGESSVSSLKQIVASRGAQIPNLTRLLSYLEITSNQEYLVARLRKLASGGYISDHNWNSGGEVKGRKWADDLPTDCDLIMHVLCIYMDSHLPADPRFPDGKTFTSKYFVKMPDKPKRITDDKLVIHQNKTNPPHFRLVAKDTDYNIPQGRNNMFHALLLFLHDIKSNKAGMLGNVNLGASGINILWILDGNYESPRH